MTNRSTNQGPPFYGKYRGIVTKTDDPQNRGRIRAKVLDIYGENESGWALPALPYAGNGVGLFLLPPVDSWVWIEFENGDTEYPIWSGCFWGESDTVPADPARTEMKVLKTGAGTITLNDKQGSEGITIETKDGMKIVLDSNGIEINNGNGASIKLSDNKVTINNDALEVM